MKCGVTRPPFISMADEHALDNNGPLMAMAGRETPAFSGTRPATANVVSEEESINDLASCINTHITRIILQARRKARSPPLMTGSSSGLRVREWGNIGAAAGTGPAQHGFGPCN